MKHAKANRSGGHRRTGRGGDHANIREYRLTAIWPERPDQPAVYRGTDRARLRATARGLADKGAHVTLAEYTGLGVYRTLAELDGPAILATRRAAERAAAEAEQARIAAAQAARAQARRAAAQAAREHAATAALMVQPPVPRTPQQRTARHTTGRRT